MKGRYAVSDNVKFDGSARWSKSDADMDNGFPVSDNDDTSESEQWSGFARASVEGFGLDHQFSVSTSDIERQTFSARRPRAPQPERQAPPRAPGSAPRGRAPNRERQSAKAGAERHQSAKQSVFSREPCRMGPQPVNPVTTQLVGPRASV